MKKMIRRGTKQHIELRKRQVNEIKEQQSNKHKQESDIKKENDKMNKRIFDSTGKEISNADVDSEFRKELNMYIRSEGQIRNLEGFTTQQGKFLIPSEIIAGKSLENTVRLKEHVNVIKVQTGAGKYPTRKLSKSRLYSVEELEENPKLTAPDWIETEFNVKTYRGSIPVSSEMMEDSAIDLTNEVLSHIEELQINTENYEIANILKDFETREVSSLDDIKRILNVDLLAGYQRKSIVTQSFYNKLDIAKNEKGDYIGKEIIKQMNIIQIVPDYLLGKEGEAKAFLGDPERAVLFADRKQATIYWEKHDVYGKFLMGTSRFDVVKNDKDAGFLATFV